MDFINLIQNENMKIYRKISTWIMIFFLILPIGFMVYDYFKQMEYADNWKEVLRQENSKLQNQLSKLSPNAPVVARYQEIIAKNQYRIDHDLKPSRSNEFVINSFNQLYSLIFVFTIIIAGGIVAGEFSGGTIKLLTIRPFRRWKILLAKYIATILFAIFCMILLLVLFMLIGGIFLGWEGMLQDIILYQNGEIKTQNILTYIVQDFGLGSVELIMLSTVAFLISTIFRNQSLAIGISLTLFFIGSTISTLLLKKYDWAKYIFLNNLDLKSYLDGTPLTAGMTLEFSITVLAVHYVIFLALAWFVFQKRDIAN